MRGSTLPNRGIVHPLLRVWEFLKYRGEMNAAGDDLKTKHVETSGAALVIRH